MKTIDTLVEDIYSVIDSNDFQVTEEEVKEFGEKLARHLAYRINEERGKSELRMSNLGKPCERQLWYDINAHELGEKISPATQIKFLFGDILEELMLFLAKKAGHRVEGEQERLEVNGVVGHRDAIIDGVQVDCKSASSFAFKKFKNHEVEKDDPFGYLDQQNLYLHASQDDPRVTEKDKFSFLVIDKAQGHICLDTYPKTEADVEAKVEAKKQVVNAAQPPARGFEDVPDGKSGNKKLGVNCSYCAYKFECWDKLKVYNYSTGPRFLTVVHKEPKVSRIKTAEGVKDF